MKEPASDSVRHDAELMREFLADRDIMCPGCNYNLRRLQSANCPECGQLLKLQIGLVDPMTGPFLAGLIGLVAGAGFSALMLCFGISMLIKNGGGAPRNFFAIIGAGLLVEGLSAAFWVRYRGRLHRISPIVRWFLVTGCWVLTALNLTVFISFLR